MRIEVTFEREGEVVDRFEFDSRKSDLVAGFAAATKRFRRNYPEITLADTGVSIKIAKSGPEEFGSTD